jgi:hypothetical protein
MHAMCPAHLFHPELITIGIMCFEFVVLTEVAMESSDFWEVTVCSPGDSEPIIQSRQQVGLCFIACFNLVSCLAYSWTLKMEASYFLETTCTTTKLYIIISQKQNSSETCIDIILTSNKVTPHY